MRFRGRRKIAQKKTIFIIGEGLTEQYYFLHLKRIKNYQCTVRPRFFGKTDITQIEKVVQKLLMGGVTVICVFDADVSTRNEVENKKLSKFKNAYKKDDCVIICDSLPCIEFWFLIHFVQTNKSFNNSKSLEKDLKKYISDYEKTKKYLENPKWVELLVANQQNAMVNVKLINVQEGGSYSNIDKAIEILERNR